MKNTIPILLLWIFLSPVYAQQASLLKALQAEQRDTHTHSPPEVGEVYIASEIEVVESPSPVGDMLAGLHSSTSSPVPGEYLVYKPGLPAAAGIDRSGATRSDTIPKGTSLVDNSTSHQQESEGSSAYSDTLTIGDQIPSGIEFSEVLQYDSDKLKLDDYRGKHVILEFWAPTCTASIASLPQLDAIQKKYGERIAVLPITVFPEDRILATISGNERLEAVELPLVVDAQKMRSYFPHSVIPHVVILDPKGLVVAITGIEDLTTAKLDELLSTGESSFRIKKDTRVRLPKGERLISEASEIGNKNIWFQSAMTGYIPELSGGVYQRFEGMSHIRITNMPLYNPYQLAYSGRSMVDYYGRNRFETIGFDKEELTSDKVGNDYREWMAEGNHVFGYELISPANTDPYELMKSDLRRFFPHIEASVEKKERMVYALVQQEGRNYPLSTSAESSYSTDGGLKMRNLVIQGLVHHLNVVFMRNSPYPVINKSGLDYPIDLSLKANLSDVESLRGALREKGLDLILREEEINVLVLRKIAEPKLLAL